MDSSHPPSTPVKVTNYALAQTSTDLEPEPDISSAKNCRHRRLPNELVAELCSNIRAVETPDRMLLTSFNMYTYSEERFRRKLLQRWTLYGDAIGFIVAQVSQKKGCKIRIDRVPRNTSNEHTVLSRQRQTDTEYLLVTNQLRLSVDIGKWCKRESLIHVSDSGLGSAHLRSLVHLVAQLVQPNKLDLSHTTRSAAELVPFLNALGNNCFRWIRLHDFHLLSDQIGTALANWNRLEIEQSMKIPKWDWPQFCGALTRWLTSAGANRQCLLYYPCLFNRTMLDMLLDQVKTEFSGATRQCPFGVRFSGFHTREPLGEFTVHNGNGEQLQLRRSANDYFGPNYALVRRPIGLADHEVAHLEPPEFELIDRRVSKTMLINEHDSAFACGS